MTDVSPKPLYNGIGLQKLRTLARLTEGPATGEQLQRVCQSSDPAAIVEALQELGHNITTHRLHRIGLDGSISHVGLYVLKVFQVPRASLLCH